MNTKRTEFSKLTELEDGRKHLILSPQLPLTYKEDYGNESEEWKDIDLTPRVSERFIAVDQAPYALEAYAGTKIVYTSRRKREVLEVCIQGAEDIQPTVRDGNIWWENAFLDADICLVLRPDGVEFLVIVKSPDAPKRYVWEYVSAEGVDASAYVKPVRAEDADGKRVKIETTIETQSRGDRSVQLLSVSFEEMLRAVKNTKVRVPSWEPGIRYPVTIDPTVNEGITTDANDDGTEFIGFGWYADGDAGLTNVNTVGNGYYVSDGGIRFQTVDIPQAATITSAILTIKILSVTASPNGAKIYADDVDDAAAFAIGNVPSGITKTTATTTMNSVATGTYNIDVTALVQEIVDRAGWVANNDIRFGLFKGSLGSGHEWTWADTGHAGGGAAAIEIVYTSGGGSPAAPTPAILQPISGGVVTSGGGMGL